MKSDGENDDDDDDDESQDRFDAVAAAPEEHEDVKQDAANGIAQEVVDATPEYDEVDEQENRIDRDQDDPTSRESLADSYKPVSESDAVPVAESDAVPDGIAVTLQAESTTVDDNDEAFVGAEHVEVNEEDVAPQADQQVTPQADQESAPDVKKKVVASRAGENVDVATTSSFSDAAPATPLPFAPTRFADTPPTTPTTPTPSLTAPHVALSDSEMIVSKKKLKALKNRLKRAEEKSKTLMEEGLALSSKLGEEEDNTRTLERALRDSQDVVKRLETTLAESNETLERTRVELAEANDSIQALRSEMDADRTAASELVQTVKEESELATTAQRRVTALETEVREAREEHEKTVHALEALEESRGRATEETRKVEAALREEVRAAKNAAAKTEAALAEMERDAVPLARRLNELSSKVSKLESENAALTNAAVEARRNADDVDVDRRSAYDALISSHAEEIQAFKDAFEGERRKLTQAHLERLEREKIEVDDRLANLAQKHNSETARLEALVSSKTNECAALETMCNELRAASKIVAPKSTDATPRNDVGKREQVESADDEDGLAFLSAALGVKTPSTRKRSNNKSSLLVQEKYRSTIRLKDETIADLRETVENAEARATRAEEELERALETSRLLREDVSETRKEMADLQAEFRTQINELCKAPESFQGDDE